MRARTGDAMAESPSYKRYTAMARAALGEERFGVLFAEGRGLVLESLVARAAG